MMKSFRPWRVDETWLLAPSVQDFVPAGHPAHLLRDIVRESRIMLGRDGFIQGYNGQAAVDGKQPIIVAHRVTQNASDQDGLLPLLDATAVSTGRLPDAVSADNGFCSEPISPVSSSAACGVMWQPDVPNTRLVENQTAVH